MKVELIQITENPELLIEKAGRVCYDSAEKTTDKSAAAMIRALMKNKHLSVVEHASAGFMISGVSRALTHQLVRSRIASFSQRSQRYTSEDNKQKKTQWSKYTNREELEITALYRNRNLSTEQISEFYGCTQQTISNIIIRNGGMIREPGEFGCIDPNLFASNNLTPRIAQLIGLIFADGCLFESESPKVRKIVIKMKEPEYIRQISDIFQTKATTTSDGLNHVELNSRSNYSHLVDTWGLTPRKSLTLSPDLVEQNMPQEMIHHFIRGFFEGDGCVGIYGPKLLIDFACASEVFINWLNVTISRYSGAKLKNIKKSMSRSGNPCYHLVYQGIDDIRKVLEWMYTEIDISFLMTRKILKSSILCKTIANEVRESVLRFCGDTHTVIPPSILENTEASIMYCECIGNAFSLYNSFEGIIPNEDRRFLLPNACTSEIYMTMNFRELLHTIDLRVSPHAQWEIRELFTQIWKILYDQAPTVFGMTYFEHHGESIIYKEEIFVDRIKISL